MKTSLESSDRNRKLLFSGFLGKDIDLEMCNVSFSQRRTNFNKGANEKLLVTYSPLLKTFNRIRN